MCATYFVCLILIDLLTLIIFGDNYNYLNPHYITFFILWSIPLLRPINFSGTLNSNGN